jgi:hypothetical protein
MSALGQKRRFRHIRVTSAFPLIATEWQTRLFGSFVPTTDILTLTRRLPS